ncbi:BlaI/MecI/CopY family transcriptional regulator [Gimesia chilikensis]|uniref:Penicillinase repressor n=1 Tax=Gimesia chilikensis TaxID=2605989 RepID=A0A517PWZ8_9PLAN|nr:BlaI/MecI/CopY family transcriptional regulator [Gimesia chilikensis]MCR9231852.1 BlaI/MecI/CopY family transcriptional regulator [bacterium]QDT23889.1 Penicillinase repressor [Gimesia chilikensis]QDT87691.1 Penicillinase repressor [Gimesia chilikensis]
MSQQAQLSRRERQIMDSLYSRGEATVLEIQSDLPSPPTPTAIRTMLRILMDKSLIQRHKQGREFVYAPTSPRRPEGTKALKHVVQTFFDGSFKQALAAQLASDDEALTDDELREMVKLIKAAREKGN